VIEAVEDPRPERMHLEENTLLAKLIKLRIAVKQSGRDELVEDADYKWWKDGEEYVIEGQRPGFEDDLSREAVLERILRVCNQNEIYQGTFSIYVPKIASYTMQCSYRRNRESISKCAGSSTRHAQAATFEDIEIVR